MNERATHSGEEKTFVAMAAAMGGCCRICAERLFAVAQSLDMDAEDPEEGSGPPPADAERRAGACGPGKACGCDETSGRAPASCCDS